MRLALTLSMLLIAAGPAWAAGSAGGVIATTFADPADVAAYKACLKRGGSAEGCLAVGDNAIGRWGDRTDGPTPMCALPPRDWRQRWGSGQKARGQKIVVSYAGRQVTCELRDTLPAHPKNGAGIDLNPAAARALGLRPPAKVSGVHWRWAE